MAERMDSEHGNPTRTWPDPDYRSPMVDGWWPERLRNEPFDKYLRRVSERYQSTLDNPAHKLILEGRR